MVVRRIKIWKRREYTWRCSKVAFQALATRGFSFLIRAKLSFIIKGRSCFGATLNLFRTQSKGDLPQGLTLNPEPRTLNLEPLTML